MRRKNFIISLLAVCILSCGAAMGAAAEFTAVSASPGGSWYAIMGGLCEILQQSDPYFVCKSIPGTGVVNPITVGSGQAQLGTAFPPNIAEAFANTGAYEGKPKVPGLRTIVGGLGYAPLQIVIRTDFAEKYGIKTLKDIAEKKPPIRLAMSLAGSTDELWGRKLLEANGITYDDLKKWGGKISLLGETEHVTLMKDKHADMSISNNQIPAATIVEMTLSVPISVIPFTESDMEYMTKHLSHAPFIIPAGTYKGQDKDLQIAAVSTTIITNEQLSEDVVYKIAKIFDENKEKIRALAPGAVFFEPKDACANLGAPLHPGAEKYYREQGYID